jgi:hypothetical protein
MTKVGLFFCKKAYFLLKKAKAEIAGSIAHPKFIY